MKRMLLVFLSALMLFSPLGCARTASDDMLADAFNKALKGQIIQSPAPTPEAVSMPENTPVIISGNETPTLISGNETPALLSDKEVLEFLCNGVWVCELEHTNFYGDDRPINGYLFFDEDGSVRYEVGYGTSSCGEAYEIWKGYCYFPWDDEQKAQIDKIDFGLDLAYSAFGLSDEVQMRYAHISAGCKLEMDNDKGFILHLEEGDPLYSKESRPILEQDFNAPSDYHFKFLAERKENFNLQDMSDNELVEYVLAKAPAANEAVNMHGMKALVTGEFTQLHNEGHCRDVWFGTNLKGKFTKELLYTVGESGAVYYYNPMLDEWNFGSTGYTCNHGNYKDIENEANTFLALVKYNKTLKDGGVRLLVDDVLWVNDEEEPNDYRIENSVEKWIPCAAYDWTQYYMFVYDLPNGMGRVQVNMSDFVAEKASYKDEFLAMVTMEGGIISIISEVYTP